MVRTSRELESAIKICRSEAKAAFGDDSLYLEKWLDDNRHVEIQVAVDQLRRRDPPRRARLLRPAAPPEDPRGGADAGAVRRRPARRWRSTAIRAVVAAGYENVGHARVPRRRHRHRVLHRDQLPDPGGAPGHRDAHRHRPRGPPDPDRRRRAAGAAPVGHRDPRPRHRVPHQRRGPGATTSGPAPGSSSSTTRPAGPGIRMDSHIYPGYEVPPYYDSLLGKLIVWGPDRADGDRAQPGRAGGAARRGRDHEHRDPSRAARERDVPGGPHDDEPARPRRRRRVPRRGGPRA